MVSKASLKSIIQGPLSFIHYVGHLFVEGDHISQAGPAFHKLIWPVLRCYRFKCKIKVGVQRSKKVGLELSKMRTERPESGNWGEEYAEREETRSCGHPRSKLVEGCCTTITNRRGITHLSPACLINCEASAVIITGRFAQLELEKQAESHDEEVEEGTILHF